MDGDFGHDGLISSQTLYAFDTAEACFRKIIDVAKTGTIFERNEAPGWWVEEHQGIEHSPVYVTEPHPQIAKPELPNWFKAEFNSLRLPTNEEVMTVIGDFGSVRNYKAVVAALGDFADVPGVFCLARHMKV